VLAGPIVRLSSRTVSGPSVIEDIAELSLPDRGYGRVGLVHELRRPRLVPFRRRGARWELQLEQPPVDRLEYLLELEHRDGQVERVPDPGNPRRAAGAFGEKSVLEFPGYEPPEWIDDDESPKGDLRELPLRSRRLRTEIKAMLWSAAETDPRDELPLIFVHDGPEYARFSGVLRLFEHLVASAEVPPFRAALVPPPLDRSETYSASARYARALADEWLPALAGAAPFPSRPIGLGASLGAVALLHAHWSNPGLFGGLFLQSGSFFRRRFDLHEAAFFGRFHRITRFVSTVAGSGAGPDPISVTMTCGTGEENLENNRFLAATLASRGWDVPLVEHRDAHNWISWRDVLHPNLAQLLLRA
jgi:enterochelin esterase-like enzyme